MERKYIIIFMVIVLAVFKLSAQNIQMIKGQDITNWKNNTSDTIYVINFWATWCKPCIEEMPDLEKIGELYRDKKVKVVLVSNDFKKQIDVKLKPFLIEKNIRNQVVFMDETNPNNWIDKVHPDWSGTIPATLILQGSTGFSKFHEATISFEELNQIIKSLNP